MIIASHQQKTDLAVKAGGKMFDGMIESARSCLKEEIRMDIIANNLANSNVIGFKSGRISFQQMLENAEKADRPVNSSDKGDSNRMLINLKTDMSQGDIRRSGNELDLAIFGKGFFKISTPEGFRYTRKGNFTLDSQGGLITHDGNMVMGKGGPINFVGDEKTIDEQGFLSVDGTQVDQFDIVDFEDYENLINAGGSVFMHTSPSPAEKPPPPETSIKQGYIELSNVNIAEEMVSMIHSLRAFESYQKAIQALDGLNNRAINEVGRLR